MRVIAPKGRVMDIATCRPGLGTVSSVGRDKGGRVVSFVRWDDGTMQAIDPDALFPMPGARYVDSPA